LLVIVVVLLSMNCAFFSPFLCATCVYLALGQDVAALHGEVCYSLLRLFCCSASGETSRLTDAAVTLVVDGVSNSDWGAEIARALKVVLSHFVDCCCSKVIFRYFRGAMPCLEAARP